MKVLLFILGVMAVITAMSFFSAWVLMLVLGALAHLLSVPALAVGFWAALLIGMLLNIIGAAFRSSK